MSVVRGDDGKGTQPAGAGETGRAVVARAGVPGVAQAAFPVRCMSQSIQ